jgi:hypothetical protein
MILTRLDPTLDEFARGTGWKLEPRGACRDHVCVRLPAGALRADGRVDARAAAEALGMGLVEDAAHGVFALGPASGGRALASAVAPDITLPDRDGKPFSLASLRGTRVFMCAWASW